MDTQAAISRRRARYVRHRFGKPKFVLQPRDEEIIRIVSEHRVISSDDLHLRLYGSRQPLLRRLQKLFHHGYLDRPRSQRERKNAPMVYALGQEGAKVIGQEPRSSVDWSEKNRQLGRPYLEHGLMVSRFQTALRHASFVLGSANVEHWQGDGTIRSSVEVEDRRRTERIPVAPDAYFVLQVTEDEKTTRVHCFLEADRGTMTVSRFVTKLRGYFAFWRSGQAEEQFGMKNFLVVTTTTSQARADHLLEACRQVSEWGLRMFLFGTEADYLAAGRCDVLEPIWRTPADEMKHSLLE
jgi:hypothetical protein